jgi:hypothetical protein
MRGFFMVVARVVSDWHLRDIIVNVMYLLHYKNAKIIAYTLSSVLTPQEYLEFELGATFYKDILHEN